MTPEQFLYNTVKEVTDVDLIKKDRRIHSVMARCLFYHFMRKYIKSSLSATGKLLNRDHATVIHSLKSFELNMNDKIVYHKNSFEVLHYKIDCILEPYFDAEAEVKGEIDFDKYIQTKNDLKHYKKLYELEKSNSDRLERLTNGTIEKINQEILKLPEDKIGELFEYRIKPFVRMNA